MRIRSHQSNLTKARCKRNRTKWFSHHTLQMHGDVYWMLRRKTFMCSRDQTGMGRDLLCVIKWANHNSARRLSEPKKGQTLQGGGMLRKASWFSCFILHICLWSLLEKEHWARGMLGLNQYSHDNFHQLFIVWGYLGRLVVVKIHGNGQIPSFAWNTSNQHRIYGLRGSSSSSQWQKKNLSLEKLSKWRMDFLGDLLE